MPFQRIHIELTNRCNFACEFCPSPLMTRQKGAMEFGLFCAIIDEIEREALGGVINLHLMGEPLLYPRLCEAAAYVKSKGLRVNLITNGSLMTDALLNRLLDTGIDQVTFSVQTPDSRSYASRKADLAFDEWKERICRAIARIISYRGATRARLSLMTIPLSQGICPHKSEGIITRRDTLGAHIDNWLNAIASSFSDKKEGEAFAARVKLLGAHGKNMRLFAQNQLAITDNFEVATWILKKWAHQGLFAQKFHKACIGYCGGLTEQFGILWNGDMVFCCYDFDGKTVFGNAAHTIKASLGQSYITGLARDFRHYKIRHPYCRRCLGDVSFWPALLRQCSSIAYHKWFKKYRTQKYALD